MVHRTSEPSKINLRVVSVESDTIEVEWTQSIGIRNYEIEISLFDLAAKLKTEQLDTNTNTFKITTLMPFTQYQIDLKELCYIMYMPLRNDYVIVQMLVHY